MSSNIKIYHIVHIDKLPSILSHGRLFCDSIVQQLGITGTTIGMDQIKARRMRNPIKVYSTCNLMVGDCVPFYFCPRSVMLYVIHKRSQDLSYKGGQEPIIHLVADMARTISWAEKNNLRWAFTKSNAGAGYFESYNDLSQLNQIDWNAVNSQLWRDCKEGKQAEFLIEKIFPWDLVEQIGVYSDKYFQQVSSILEHSCHSLTVSVQRNWYY